MEEVARLGIGVGRKAPDRSAEAGGRKHPDLAKGPLQEILTGVHCKGKWEGGVTFALETVNSRTGAASPKYCLK